MTGPDTSSMALTEASCGDSPSSIWRSTASTTTMASSTTKPMARIMPNKDSVLMEKPSIGKTMNVPINETGTAARGMRAGRHPCRKMYTTIMTRARDSNRVTTISRMPAVTASVVSNPMLY